MGRIIFYKGSPRNAPIIPEYKGKVTWAGPHSILARWRFPMRDQASGSSLLHNHRYSDILRMQKHGSTRMIVSAIGNMRLIHLNMIHGY